MLLDFKSVTTLKTDTKSVSTLSVCFNCLRTHAIGFLRILARGLHSVSRERRDIAFLLFLS